jgi:hypothetical protein
MEEISREELKELIVPITDYIGDRVLDESLEADLNKTFPATGPDFKAIESACHAAIKDGWMCKYEAGGIRYGRVIKPTDDLNAYSVDVVDMENTRGPHHSHPKGEVDMVMPIQGDARFDGKAAGWKVYAAKSAHYPTVTEGRALVLYLLPDGEIEFT